MSRIHSKSTRNEFLEALLASNQGILTLVEGSRNKLTAIVTEPLSQERQWAMLESEDLQAHDIHVLRYVAQGRPYFECIQDGRPLKVRFKAPEEFIRQDGFYQA